MAPISSTGIVTFEESYKGSFPYNPRVLLTGKYVKGKSVTGRQNVRKKQNKKTLRERCIEYQMIGYRRTKILFGRDDKGLLMTLQSISQECMNVCRKAAQFDKNG